MIPRSRSSGALSIVPKSRTATALNFVCSTFVIADVSVVFDCDRHAEQRAVFVGGVKRVGPIRVGEGPLGEDDAVRVEKGIHGLDLRQRGLDELAGRHLAGADQTRLRRGPGVGKIGGIHD